jgi:hypothetical protein
MLRYNLLKKKKIIYIKKIKTIEYSMNILHIILLLHAFCILIYACTVFLNKNTLKSAFNIVTTGKYITTTINVVN